MTEHAAPEHHRRLSRGPAVHGHHRVGYIELFFDLVFVFAITQLSHALMGHPTLYGLFGVTVVTMAVWWVWIFFCWSTNWADPERFPVRIMLMVMMGAGVVMSASIPHAAEDKAMPFAIAYVFMHLGRGIFMLPIMREYSEAHYRNFQRVLCWIATASVFWIAGAWFGGKTVFVFWLIALLIEYSGPAARFYTPGLGQSGTAEWDIEPGHFAERCALFIILSLGESILVTGATFEKLPWTFPISTAFAASLAGTAAMWAIYFSIGQERGVNAMRGSADPGRIARAYTYLHLPIVMGIIVTAVGDEFVLAHATGHADAKTLAASVGGPLLYVLGCGLFKRATAGWFPLSHMVGIAALVLMWAFGGALEPWLISIITSLILIVMVIWERISLGTDATTKIGHPRERARKAAESQQNQP
ncbi:MAG: low temperature requirement protein A [Proteobacteria bacterium]|nr:low temperature requirement protein A [Pseudomonadota bacterium]